MLSHYEHKNNHQCCNFDLNLLGVTVFARSTEPEAEKRLVLDHDCLDIGRGWWLTALLAAGVGIGRGMKRAKGLTIIPTVLPVQDNNGGEGGCREGHPTQNKCDGNHVI